MSMITPMLASMYATSLSHNAASAMFGASQSRMALANGVSGNESLGQVASLARQDKALQLEGIRAQSLYFAAQLMQESAQRMQKKNTEQRQRMIENGVLFF